jgi:hypothetical protein
MRIKCAAIPVVCLSFPLSIFALCFESPRPCTWYASHHGQPTFIGTAVSEETVPDVLKLGDHELHVTVQKVIFNVEETFDGVPAKTVAVYGEGTTNDFHFNVGEKYLVYAWREGDGKIRTAMCTRTSVLSQAKDDLEFLRSLPTRQGGEIFGQVRLVSSGSQVGALAGTITESGPDGEHKSRVSDSGSYELTGLVPGDYRETFILDRDSTEFVNLKVRIPVNGSCAESGFRVGNIPVSGRVLGDAGNARSGATVTLFYAPDGQYHPDVFLRTQTDSSGKFVFPHVEPAKFILAAQPLNSAITFFRSTRDSSKTELIQIVDSTPLRGLIVRVLGSSKSN